MKKALITGITGQDGAYLAEFLLNKGYEVHGIKRRSSLFNTQRIDHIYEDPHIPDRHLHLHYGDLSDSTNLIRIIQEVQPYEIYNLGAMSHVQVSFEEPEYTANVDGIGTLRILEAIRFRLEQKNMSEKDLAVVLGYRSRKSEILSGKRKLSLSMIRKLNEELNIPAASLIQAY